MHRVVADSSVLTRHGLEAERFVLAVGNLAVHKNLAALSKLAQRLDQRGVPLVITGQLDKNVFETKGTRLPEPALYIGRISDGELKALYESAFCFVFPSRYEGFGLPAVEAMASGCPVVVSRIPVLQEVCGETALYFDPDSPADIVQSVERVFGDPALREKLRHEGRQRASLFNWDRAAQLLVAELLPHLGAPVATRFCVDNLLKIAVGIPTSGPASILCETLRELQQQTRQPDLVVVCGTKIADMDGAEQRLPAFVCSSRKNRPHSAAQRHCRVCSRC